MNYNPNINTQGMYNQPGYNPYPYYNPHIIPVYGKFNLEFLVPQYPMYHPSYGNNGFYQMPQFDNSYYTQNNINNNYKEKSTDKQESKLKENK